MNSKPLLILIAALFPLCADAESPRIDFDRGDLDSEHEHYWHHWHHHGRHGGYWQRHRYYDEDRGVWIIRHEWVEPEE